MLGVTNPPLMRYGGNGEVSSLIHAEQLLAHIEAMDVMTCGTQSIISPAVRHRPGGFIRSRQTIWHGAGCKQPVTDRRACRTAMAGIVPPFERCREWNCVWYVARKAAGRVARTALSHGLRQGWPLAAYVVQPWLSALQPIDWSTPASILERSSPMRLFTRSHHGMHCARALPEDRRCFCFFHPRMPESR